MPNRPGKKDLRVVLNEEDVTLLRRLAVIIERSPSSIVGEALQNYFAREEIQRLIELHKLDTTEEE